MLLVIDPESESNAGICLNCIVTLEGFQQFKEQCHENDKFLKTVPPKGSVQVPEAGEEDEHDDTMECDFLEGDADTEHSEEEGLVEADEPLVENPNTEILKATKKPAGKLITSETSDSEEEEPPKTPKKTVSAESPSTENPEAPKMQPEKLITSRRVNLFDVESSTRVRKQIAKPPLNPRTDLIELSKVLEEKYRGPEPTEDDLPKLLDSYPDTFHFVKSTPHAKFYTLVYYGEPYNSAVYEYAKTYYRCAYKRQFQCPALLHVSNDYTEFERRFEHTHDEQEPKKTRIKPVLLTPRQALPDIFRRCWHKLEQINPELEFDAVLCFDCIVTLEGFFQFKEQCHVNDEFLKTLPPKDSAEDSDASEVDEPKAALECYYLEAVEKAVEKVGTVNDSEEEGLVEEYDAFEPPLTIPKGRVPVEPPAKEIFTIKVEPEFDTRKSSRVRKPTAKVLASPKKFTKVEIAVKTEPEGPPQKRPKLETPNIRGPTADELPKLQDYYPDYFHFERGPRSVHYNLIFYGERYNSAIYGSRYTFWQCAHRKAYRCPAMVRVSNDYTTFERRLEHTHGDLPEKGEHDLYTPKQVLPEVFRICWQKAMVKKIKRKETTGPKKRYHNATEETKSENSDEEFGLGADHGKGVSLQKALRKSGVLDSDED